MALFALFCLAVAPASAGESAIYKTKREGFLTAIRVGHDEVTYLRMRYITPGAPLAGPASANGGIRRCGIAKPPQ